MCSISWSQEKKCVKVILECSDMNFVLTTGIVGTCLVTVVENHRKSGGIYHILTLNERTKMIF